MNGWTSIFETDQLYRAEIMKGLLQDNGIQAIILNRKDSSYVMLGTVTVMVKEEEKQKAIEIIKSVNCE